MMLNTAKKTLSEKEIYL